MTAVQTVSRPGTFISSERVSLGMTLARLLSPRAAASLAVAVSLLLAGCTGTLASFEASPATIPDAALEPLGYVRGNTTAVPLTYPVGAGGVSGNVTVTSYVSGYAKTTADGDASALVVLSTPNADVGGRSVNPFAHLSNRDLTTRALATLQEVRGLSEYGAVGDLREVDSREQTVFGSPTEVVTYSGTATVDGALTETRFVVASVEHGNDVVTVVGVHAAEFDETENLGVLMERVEHDAP